MTTNEVLTLAVSLLSLIISFFGTRFWFLIERYRRWLCRDWKEVSYIGPGPEAPGIAMPSDRYIFEDHGDWIMAIPKGSEKTMRWINKTSITQVELRE